MSKKAISTDKSAKAIGPYSQAVRHGDLLFCSGAIPVDPESGEVVGKTIAEQTRRCLENLKAVLGAGGASFGHVVKVTVFLDNFKDFAGMNEVYAEYFEEPYPARSTVEVAKLPLGVKVEIEATARIG